MLSVEGPSQARFSVICVELFQVQAHDLPMLVRSLFPVAMVIMLWRRPLPGYPSQFPASQLTVPESPSQFPPRVTVEPLIEYARLWTKTLAPPPVVPVKNRSP